MDDLISRQGGGESMIDLERIRDALDEAVERGEITEQEAREEWRWSREEFFREANECEW